MVICIWSCKDTKKIGTFFEIFHTENQHNSVSMKKNLNYFLASN